MMLFLSDLHLGRGSADESRAAEEDVLLLLQEYVDTLHSVGGALILAGDLFDQYLEYRHLVPKGFARLKGRLAELSDGGVRVCYIVGNRDPWHLDYFQTELGVEVHGSAMQTSAYGRSVYIAHGDGLVPEESTYNRIKPLLRNPLIARLYRNLMPGDSAYRLARAVGRRSRGARSNGESTQASQMALLGEAQRRLRETESNVVVFGHSHRAAHVTGSEGDYLNPGYWFKDRTYATLTPQGPALFTWREKRAQLLPPSRFADV